MSIRQQVTDFHHMIGAPVQWGGVTPLQIDRCRVRRSWAERSESWFRSGHSAKPEARKIAAPPGQGIDVHPGGSWAPDLLLTHCPACREVGTRQVSGSHGTTGVWRGGGRLYGEHRDPAVATNYAPDGTETVPAWECLAVCTCGLASLAPAGGDPTRCPGCGGERWWACPVAEVDQQSGNLKSGGRSGTVESKQRGYGGRGKKFEAHNPVEPSEGGASRYYPTFQYDAKASARERQSGCEDLHWLLDDDAPIGWRLVSREEWQSAPDTVPTKTGKGKPRQNKATGNVHATIKPAGAGDDDGLMRWLLRLITPPGGRVGDISMGSGTTGVAAQIEGHDFTGCDIDAGTVEIARRRTAFWTPDRHRQVLADAAALKAHEIRVAREKASAEPQDFGPLFAGRTP